MQPKLTIQERLKDLRVERGLTLEQLSAETGISKLHRQQIRLRRHCRCHRYHHRHHRNQPRRPPRHRTAAWANAAPHAHARRNPSCGRADGRVYSSIERQTKTWVSPSNTPMFTPAIRKPLPPIGGLTPRKTTVSGTKPAIMAPNRAAPHLPAERSSDKPFFRGMQVRRM